MPHYEHVFLARQDISTAQVDALTEQFKSVLTGQGGSVGKTEYWGLRPLSYRIRKNRKAHYTLLNVTAPAAAVAEMERQMSINEDILRFMTVRVEEHEEGPSAQMRGGRERGERGERGERSFGDRDRDRGDRGGFGDRGPRPPRPPRDQDTSAEAEAN